MWNLGTYIDANGVKRFQGGAYSSAKSVSPSALFISCLKFIDIGSEAPVKIYMYLQPPAQKLSECHHIWNYS